MTPDPPRYLRYDELQAKSAGMQHQLRNLQWLLREAFMHGRLAVLPILNLESRHNSDRADGLGQWDTYFDLDASRLVCANGHAHPLPIARQLPDRQLRTLTLTHRGRMPRDADRADLVVRPIRNVVYSRDLPYDRARRLFGDVLAGPARVTFDMRPSRRVRALGEPVAAALASRFGTYTAVHIRRGQGMRQARTVRRRTEPHRVSARLAKLGVRYGDPVFFLSDEGDPEYWRALGRSYEVIRYTDFDDLAAVVAGNRRDAPDNYLLYEAEKVVMGGATFRVETVPGPNYTPAHGTLIRGPEWTLANVRSRLRRTIRRSIPYLRGGQRAGPARKAD